MSTTRTLAISGLTALALVVAACGGDDSDSESSPAGAPSAVAIATRADTAIGTVVVDAAGMTLYTAERESDGTVKCVDACAEFWPPATVDSADPQVAPELADRVGTIERPDGGMQATFDGLPLYRFTEDGQAGDTSGDGVEDVFGGSGFVWHAAVVDGVAAGAGTPATTQPGLYGGY